MEPRRCLALVLLEILGTMYSQYYVLAVGVLKNGTDDGENITLADLEPVWDTVPEHICRTPLSPKNGHLYCGKLKTSKDRYICKAACDEGFEFPNKEKKGRLYCNLTTNEWDPRDKFEDCAKEVVCNPDCKNGGVCREGNVCTCHPRYEGAACEKDKCKDIPSLSNGKISCKNSTEKPDSYECEADCNPDFQFSSRRQKERFSCNLKTGEWQPKFEVLACNRVCDPPCQNGGTCLAQNKCYCSPNFKGGRCEDEKCKTPSVPPNGKQKCSEILNTDKYMCIAECNPGYLFPSGALKENITCDRKTGNWETQDSFPNCVGMCYPGCQNGGLCVGKDKCACHPDFEGRWCEKAICNLRCQNGGTCMPGNVCSCPESFTGRTCEETICNPPCQNGGTCLAGNVCNCPASFKGERCNEENCNPPCQNGGICVAGNVCYCLAPFKGRTCEETKCTPPCQNGGTCMPGNICNCPNSFVGRACEESLCHPGCQNGGICVAKDICACHPAFDGLWCEKAIAAIQCNPPCQNGGTCMPGNVCNCPESFTGRTCEENHCNPPCENGGICVPGNVCNCSAPFTGRRCEEITRCVPPCQNGGTCMARNICNCPEFFTGRSCEQTHCNPPCENGGICVPGNVCLCSAPFTGRRCEEIRECVPPCQNGGTCMDGNICRCRESFTGRSCEKGLCHPPCQNGGICVENDQCACHPDFEGRWCEKAICNPPCENGEKCLAGNVCNSAVSSIGRRYNETKCNPPCENGGICAAGDVCYCPVPFTGRRCEERICSPPCQNGGKCSAGNTCDCPAPFTGGRCSETRCNPRCQNGGICAAGNVCYCPMSFTGRRCEQRICSPPCQNGGTCLAGNVCSCPEPFTGERCGERKCNPPCKNGGTCVTVNICNCPESVTGRTCEGNFSKCGLGVENIGISYSRIVGGSVSDRPWPWMAALYIGKDRKSMKCGGSIIHQQFILTAAHCLFDYSGRKREANEIIVKLGLRDLRDGTYLQQFEVRKIHAHKQFRKGSLMDYDIALLQLDQPIVYNAFVRPICLPEKVIPENFYKPQEIAWAIGWGDTKVVPKRTLVSPVISQVLKEIPLPIQPRETCAESLRDDNYVDYFTERMFCAGSGEGKNDTCRGDSGGPVMQPRIIDEVNLEWTQVGLISWGLGCALKSEYGFHTHLHELLPWVQETIEEALK